MFVRWAVPGTLSLGRLDSQQPIHSRHLSPLSAGELEFSVPYAPSEHTLNCCDSLEISSLILNDFPSGSMCSLVFSAG